MDELFIHDATPTWSGFIYQGDIAIYLAVKKICELKKRISMSDIGAEYKLEVEFCEDIAIVHEKDSIKKYISIHQVKNQKDTAISSYKSPLIQLMLEKSLYKRESLEDTEAYLHVSKSLKSKSKEGKLVECKGDTFKEKLSDWKEGIEKYYISLKDIRDKYQKNEVMNLQQNLLDLIATDPINLKRSKYSKYCNDLRELCEKKTDQSQNILIILNGMIVFLEEKLAINHINENVAIYKYGDDKEFCDGEAIYDKIVHWIKDYKGEKLDGEEYTEEDFNYLADKLLDCMRKHIVERHKAIQENNPIQESIPFQKFIDILDGSLEYYNEDANILALRRIYSRQLLQFCDYVCENHCNISKGVIQNCKIKNTEYVNIHLDDEEFLKLCYGLNPDCTANISNRECLNTLLNEDGMDGSVFKIISKVPEQFFKNKNDSTRYVIDNEAKNAFLTAITSHAKNKVVVNIVKAIENNTELVSPIFDADQLITTNLETKGDVWNNNYDTIQKKYLSSTNGEYMPENNMSEPKQPEFIKAKTIINLLCKDEEGGCC